jgi:hypothetical protein
MAMAAQRYGIPIWTYAQTRTYRELFLDVQALAKVWAWPAEVLLSALGGKGSGKGQRNTADAGEVNVAQSSARSGLGEDGVPRTFKRKPGWRYSVYDLGPIVAKPIAGFDGGRAVDMPAAVLERAIAEGRMHPSARRVRQESELAYGAETGGRRHDATSYLHSQAVLSASIRGGGMAFRQA